MNNSTKIKTIISIIITIVLVFIIYSKVNFEQLLYLFKSTEIQPFVIFLLLYLPIALLGALRWNIITNKIGKCNLSYFNSLKQTVGSYSANLIVPAKMGEFIRVYWLRKHKLKINTFWLVILEKYWDIFTIFSILIVAMSFIILQPDFEPSVYHLLIWIVSFLVLTMMKFFDKFIIKTIRAIFRKFKKNENDNIDKEKLLAFFPENKILLFQLYVISVILWITQLSQFYFIFKMFSTKIPLAYLFAGTTLALLSALFPFSISGIGPRDAVIVWFFGQFATIEILSLIGILSALRVIIAGLLGLPWFYNQTKEA